MGMRPIGPLGVRRGLLQHDNLYVVEDRGQSTVRAQVVRGGRYYCVRLAMLAIASTGRFSGRVILKGAILPALDRGKEGLMMHLPRLDKAAFSPTLTLWLLILVLAMAMVVEYVVYTVNRDRLKAEVIHQLRGCVTQGMNTIG
jgi:hypothetical protein